jgi:type VI secretion system protein ImpL
VVKQFIAFFKRRWVVSMLKLLGTLVIIWMVGPHISIGNWTPLSSLPFRVGASLTIVFLWLLYWLYVSWLEKTKANKIVEGLLGEPRTGDISKEAPAAKDLLALRNRMEEALHKLKEIKPRGSQYRGNYLYYLPWYIFIGPPGSGKTTALRASGLRFPLEKQFRDIEIHGISGTKNCDWVFTDQAVLLDTAGRFVTHDSEPEVDRSAWLGFLDLLKKYRSRQPINGVLVAVSIVDLLRQKGDEWMDDADNIKQRIKELYTNLSLRVPVYVLFTKCDLIAGFIEFFGDFKRDDRAQVWGMTFPYDETEEKKNALTLFSEEFAILEKRLSNKLLQRLTQEIDPQSRDYIYTFPQAFSAVRPIVQKFLKHVFEPSMSGHKSCTKFSAATMDITTTVLAWEASTTTINSS